ncbi:DUF6882 domain-containing protein [Marinospirillum sp.]|uniref:DUF6882 domain-containing protein n=1 Tax=Marinospirillum sp. TaxID=2183934 RepID=UPI003A8B703C
MNPQLKNLLNQSVGHSFAKQLAFGDLLGDGSWRIDLTEGRVFFGDDLSFRIQLLGTESEGNATWLWAWANEASNLPAELLELCTLLKTTGEQGSIPELSERSFPLEQANGHTLAMIAAGLFNCCYYRAPYPGGALFFLVQNPPAQVAEPVGITRAATVITEVISEFDVDHLAMSEAFLTSQGFTVSRGEQSLIGEREQRTMTLTFDTGERITRIQVD